MTSPFNREVRLVHILGEDVMDRIQLGNCTLYDDIGRDTVITHSVGWVNGGENLICVFLAKTNETKRLCWKGEIRWRDTTGVLRINQVEKSLKTLALSTSEVAVVDS